MCVASNVQQISLYDERFRTVLDSSASQLLADLDAGRVSATELAKACLNRIAECDGSVGAFLSVQAESALKSAAEIDRRRANRETLGALGGIPVAVKDVLCTEEEPTTCGSRMLESFRPPFDATVIRKIRKADGVIIGKLNMDEFAMGSSTENSAFQVTRNPWNLERIPGGSSGGSAACVAAGMAPIAIGSDTGGSIRQPAAHCGVSGLKPTYGRVSRFGLVAFASSLDQIGPLARSAEDLALMLGVIAGHDERDSTSVNVPIPRYLDAIQESCKGLRVGLVREHFEAGLDDAIADAVRTAVGVLESQGAEVCDVTLPHAKYAVATYYVIACCEASSNLARYDGAHYGYRTDENEMREELANERQKLLAQGNQAAIEDLDSPLVRMYRRSRSEGFGPEVKRRIMIGTYALSAGYYDAYYLKALKVRRLIRQDFDEAFQHVDVIASPVTPTTAFPIGEKTDDPLSMYLADLFTASGNLAGICGVSVPCGFDSANLPIGLQLQGPPFSEGRILQAAANYQRETDWHLRRPPLP